MFRIVRSLAITGCSATLRPVMSNIETLTEVPFSIFNLILYLCGEIKKMKQLWQQ